MCAPLCLCMWRPKDNCGFHSSGVVRIDFSLKGSLAWLSIGCAGCTDCSMSPSGPSDFLPSAEIASPHTVTAGSCECGFWEVKLGSSCMQNRHFPETQSYHSSPMCWLFRELKSKWLGTPARVFVLFN